jgi:molybdate transport system ATP-binding protein
MTGNTSLSIDIKRRLGAFSLDVRFQAEGGLTAFFGRSGSGKTSLINMLAGLDTPDSGSIEINGSTVFNSERGVNVAIEKRRLGYVFQDSRLFPHMNVRQNLNYGARFTTGAEQPYNFAEIIDLLGLSALLDRQPNSLSGGEKQRVAIGRALLAQPRLLLMDEPLASLDAGRKGEIISFIENLRDQLDIPIVYVSHAMDEVIRLADTMVILDHGTAVAAGGVEDIMSRLDLRPLTGRYEAGAVISASVKGHDETYQLSELGFADKLLWVPRLDLQPGSALRVRIRARDVSLSRIRPEHTSLLNIFEGTITEIAESQGAQVEILLDIGVPLIARVTRRSTTELGLKVGDMVFAMVKAAAIDRHSMGMAGTRTRQAG